MIGSVRLVEMLTGPDGQVITLFSQPSVPLLPVFRQGPFSIHVFRQGPSIRLISGYIWSADLPLYSPPSSYSDCNVCKAPKIGKIEERTGAGGGFNERGKVEYKERVDSDGEYDDVSLNNQSELNI